MMHLQPKNTSKQYSIDQSNAEACIARLYKDYANMGKQYLLSYL